MNQTDYERSITMYRRIISGLIIVCAALLVCGGVMLYKQTRSPKTTYGNKMILCGVYVVGEDEELPPGRYNIYPAKGDEDISITVYPDKASFDKANETGLWSGEQIDLDGKSVIGFKMKEGYRVEIFEPGAAFQKVKGRSSF